MGKHREHIAKTISYYRKSLGIKQSDLAKKLNVAPSSISAWENGSNAPDIETLDNSLGKGSNIFFTSSFMFPPP